MTTATREQVALALLSLLTSSAQYNYTSRRLRMPDQMANVAKPALFQIEHKETHVKGKLITPAYRILHVDVWIYIAIGTDPNSTPITTLNTLIDAIDPDSGGVLKPSPMNGRQTLGGLVTDCYVNGEIVKVPGDIGNGMGAAIIPIEVVYM